MMLQITPHTTAEGGGDAVAQVVEAPRYEPEGRGFDIRWCHWEDPSCRRQWNYMLLTFLRGPGRLSRYRTRCWAGRYGDRIPVGGATFSAPLQTGPGAHPASYKMSTGSLSQGWSGRGVTLITHSHLALKLKKEKSYTSTLPLGLRGLF
jgi:hypothetical protein